LLLVAALCWHSILANPRCIADEPAADFTPRLRIVFSSFRRSPQQPKIYTYEHDGVSQGKITGTIETADKHSETHASLTTGGLRAAMAHEVENDVSLIFVWDFAAKKFLDLPGLNTSPHAQLCPSISGDGRWIVFAAWSRPGSNERWDLVLYDTQEQRADPLRGINTAEFDERMPALSADSRYLAYTTNATLGEGLVDIRVFDRQEQRWRDLPGLNSAQRDVEPALSRDGRLLVFSSDRPSVGRLSEPSAIADTGQIEDSRLSATGSRDIYLYDCAAQQFLPLPGLNSVAYEQTPSLSADGRYIAFVSERTQGAGERDIYLYDRETSRLLATPGLNAPQEDLDPCVVLLPM
jgi:Tol biopolymer transport system component